jgi:hypothetical protein
MLFLSVATKAGISQRSPDERPPGVVEVYFCLARTCE